MIAPARTRQTEHGSISTGNGIEFFPVNHASTFMGKASTMASTYRDYDIALRNSIENARLMRNDSSIMECLEARQRAVALLKWHIEPEDDRSPEQKQLAEEITRVMMRTPRFMEMRRVLQEAVWYGKSAVQVMYNADWINGYRRFCILSPDRDTPAWLPIHGDKLVFRHDDLSQSDQAKGRYPFQVGIRVGSGYKAGDRVRGKYEVEHVSSQYRETEAVDRGMAYFVDQEDRSKLIIHKHSIEDGAYEDILSAGSIHGVGVRSRIYWDWLQKQEIQAMLLAYIERYHGGIEIYRFPLGNDEAEKAVDSAIRNRQPGRAALKVPIPMGEDAMQYGVEVFESSMAGVQQMQDLLTNFYGHRIKRYILGQILSSESEATGLGSGVADLHLESLLQIIEYDATGLEETITEEPLRRLQHANFPSSKGIRLRFKIDTREADSDAKLNAVRQAWEMGARVKESDVLDQCGLSAPTAADRVLPAPGGGQGQQPPGMPGMPHEGPPKIQASVPGQIGVDAQPEQFSASVYGYCPKCGAQGVLRERRIDGNDTCSNGHVYPSKQAMTNPEKYSYATQEPDLRSAIDKAAAATDPDPTDAQKLAGNYRKGQFHWNGWTIAIETPAGGIRRGRNRLGVEWSHQIPVHYGYIRRTESDADGDHIDVFVGPDPESPVVFVVDQVKGNSQFDEHKVMIGFMSEAEATDAYRASYSEGWQGFKSITAMTVNQFRAWVEEGDSGSPIEEQVSRYSMPPVWSVPVSDEPVPAALDGTYVVRSWDKPHPLATRMEASQYARQGTFNWDESDHPRNDKGEFVEKAEGGHAEQGLGESDRSKDKKGPAGLTVREAIEATGAKGEKLTHKNAVQATYLYTGTTSSDWKAVEVREMKAVDDGKGGERMAPQFIFPSGYTQIETPWSSDSAGNTCCHLCGTSIKNAYHIQNDDTKNTMLVGSECVTQFGEGDNGHQAAKKSIAAANREFVSQLQEATSSLRKIGMYEQQEVRHGMHTGRTIRKWSTHTANGKAAKELYDRIFDAMKHTTGEDIRTGERPFVIPSTDRVIANWRKAKGEEAAAALQAFSEYLSNIGQQDASRYSMEWREEDHPRDSDGKFTETEQPKPRRQLREGQVEMRQAKAGGETSDVDGKFYKGGQWMPVHGLSVKSEGHNKPPKSEGGEAPVANENARPTARSPEQIENEKRSRQDADTWAEIHSGPLGKVLGLGPQPHRIKWGHGILSKYLEVAKSLGAAESRFENVADVAKQIAKEHHSEASQDDWSYLSSMIEGHAKDDLEYAPKQHQKYLQDNPSVLLARRWIEEAIEASGRDIASLAKINAAFDL